MSDSAIVSKLPIPIAIGLTIYFVAMNVLVLVLSVRVVNVPPGLELAPIFISYSFFLLMPVRWLTLALQIVRSIRARPFGLFASMSGLQIAFALAIHVLFGFVSMIGWLTVWMEGRTADRVFGLVVHTLLPSITIAWLMRRRVRHTRQEAQAVT